MKQAKTPPGPKLRAKRERRRERWKQRITVLQRLLAAMVPPLRRKKRRRLLPPRAKAGRLLPLRWMRC